MKKLSLLFAVLFTAALLSHHAQADTDYLCLDQCLKGGKTSAICLPKCSGKPADKKAGTQTNIIKQTDYRCVNLCRGDGKSSSECLSKCTYAAAPKKAASNIDGPPLAGMDPTVSNNKVLKAPIPAGDTIYMKSQTGQKNKNASKDYACIAQCLKDGMQSQLCNQNCAEVTPEYNKSP